MKHSLHFSQDYACGRNVLTETVTLSHSSQSKKKKSPSGIGSTHGLQLYILSEVSIWMLKLCTVGVQGGEVKTAKIFDRIFLKGLSFAWEGLREEYAF